MFVSDLLNTEFKNCIVFETSKGLIIDNMFLYIQGNECKVYKGTEDTDTIKSFYKLCSQKYEDVTLEQYLESSLSDDEIYTLPIGFLHGKEIIYFGSCGFIAESASICEDINKYKHLRCINV